MSKSGKGKRYRKSVARRGREATEIVHESDLRSKAETPMIRCMSCGKVTGHLYYRYKKLKKTMTAAQALDKLGLRKQCCRRTMLAPPIMPLGLYFDQSGVRGSSSKVSSEPIEQIPLSAVNDSSQNTDETSSKSKEEKTNYILLDVDDTPIGISTGERPDETIGVTEDSFRSYEVAKTTKMIHPIRAI